MACRCGSGRAQIELIGIWVNGEKQEALYSSAEFYTKLCVSVAGCSAKAPAAMSKQHYYKFMRASSKSSITNWGGRGGARGVQKRRERPKLADFFFLISRF